jgi:hypothetical protein
MYCASVPEYVMTTHRPPCSATLSDKPVQRREPTVDRLHGFHEI